MHDTGLNYSASLLFYKMKSTVYPSQGYSLGTGEDTRKQVVLNTVRAGINSMNFLVGSTMYY